MYRYAGLRRRSWSVAWWSASACSLYTEESAVVWRSDPPIWEMMSWRLEMLKNASPVPAVRRWSVVLESRQRVPSVL